MLKILLPKYTGARADESGRIRRDEAGKVGAPFPNMVQADGGCLRNHKGFTIIELLTVVTIIGILAAIAIPNYQWGIIRAKEAVLRETLYNFRTTIDQFYADTGKYPDSLQEIADRKYLRAIPKDPFTNSNETWVVVAPPTPEDGSEVKGSVYDVHSGSNLVGTNNVPYNEW